MIARTALCRCGATFQILTYARARSGRVWHCQCPPCELAARGLTAWLALLLRTTPVGELLLRVAA